MCRVRLFTVSETADIYTPPCAGQLVTPLAQGYSEHVSAIWGHLAQPACARELFPEAYQIQSRLHSLWPLEKMFKLMVMLAELVKLAKDWLHLLERPRYPSLAFIVQPFLRAMCTIVGLTFCK